MGRRSAADVFAQRLRDLIPDGEAGRFADASGFPRESISRWRTGTTKANPTLDTLEKLAAALDVPVDYLISDGDQDSIIAVQERELKRLRRHVERLDRLFSMMGQLLDEMAALDDK